MGDPATRRRILDWTLALVTRRGGADVTMAQIARAARVSRQAVYLHFADRAFLGMYIPAGDHDIVLSYRPKEVTNAAITSIAAAVGLGVFALVRRRRSLAS